MTDDLVKRLRKRQEFEFIDGYKRVEWEDEDALAAADRIEELQRELADATARMEYLEEEIVDLGYEIRELGSRQ